MSRDWLKRVRTALESSDGLSVKENPADGSIRVASEEGYEMRLAPDGLLTCSFKADLDEIRALIADETTEDLSLDELFRVAREELRPFTNRCRRTLILAGFEEETVSDRDQFALVFKKSIDEPDAEKAGDFLKRCWKTLAGPSGSGASH